MRYLQEFLPTLHILGPAVLNYSVQALGYSPWPQPLAKALAQGPMINIYVAMRGNGVMIHGIQCMGKFM